MGNGPFAHPSFRILGARIDRPSFSEIVSYLQSRRDQGLFTHLITANALMLLELDRDAELRRIFEEADLVVPESSGLSCAAALKGVRPLERIPGIDLMQKLCEEAARRGWSVFLLGAKPGIAERAAAALQKKSPGLKIAGSAPGYFSAAEEMELLKNIQAVKPNLLFVGLQSPGQEKWIRKNSVFFDRACAMGVGGSFDVLAGNLRRAPLFFQKYGLEWLFRLIQEPWRLRRMVKLPVFLIKVLLRDA